MTEFTEGMWSMRQAGATRVPGRVPAMARTAAEASLRHDSPMFDGIVIASTAASQQEVKGGVVPGQWSIYQFLREARVPHTVVPHGTSVAGQPAATQVPSRHWAKVITCVVDGEPIEAVLPASLTVNLDRLLELAGGRDIRLAQEEELTRLFADREPEAMPPFGPLYRQSVFVDVSLASEPRIVLNAVTHPDAICLRWADFSKSVRPIVGAFAGNPGSYVGAYRLSYRE
jgi:Ala-tRNA(Pro) deacylase